MNDQLNPPNVADASCIRRQRMRDPSTTKTFCLAALLTTATVTLWVVAFVIVVGIAEELFREPRQDQDSVTQQLMFREDGLPVRKTTDYRKGGDWAEYRDLDGQPVTMTKNDEHPRMMTLIDSRLWRRPKRAIWRTRVSEVSSLHRRSATGVEMWFLRNDGKRGLFVAMNNFSRRESGYLSLKGFSTEPPSKNNWFLTFVDGEQHNLVDSHSDRGAWLGFPTSQREGVFQASSWTVKLFVEPGGRRVHEIDFSQQSVRLIHDGEPVLAANLAHSWKGDKTERAVLRTSDSLRLVELTNDAVGETKVIPLPENLRRAFGLQWVRGTDGDVLVTLQRGTWHVTSLNSAHRVTQERIVANPYAGPRQGDLTAVKIGLTAIQSPVLGDFFAGMVSHEEHLSSQIDTRRAEELGLDWPDVREASLSDFVSPLTLLHLTAIGWSVLAVRRLRRYSASRPDQWFWGVWTLLFGLPGYLAFRVHREWRRFPTCPSEVADAAISRAPSEQVENLSHGRRTIVSAYGALLDAGEHLGAGFAARVGFPASHTALVLKECRLAAGIALLACLAYVVVLARLTGLKGFGMLSDLVSPTTTVPFVHDRFAEPFVVVGMLLAVSLAVWQSAAESRGEAWLFMLHRPVSRRVILLSKLLIGLLVVTGCTALPILAYAAWAFRPGSVAAPFEWGMTEVAWRQWAALTPIYLGTLLTMLRPARWFGTRLLPVVAVFGWLVGREALGTWWWPVWWELLAVLAIDVSLASSLLLVVREREYP